MVERHTSGPWQFVAGDILDSAGRPIATVHGVHYIDGNANGRLIAEAPAMLALIKQGLDLDKNEERQCPCSLCEAGRAIVARIEGQ